MTKNCEYSSQILQSKSYCAELQNKKFSNIVYQKHQIEKIKSKILIKIHKIISHNRIN
jgi:hypothetical protein